MRAACCLVGLAVLPAVRAQGQWTDPCDSESMESVDHTHGTLATILSQHVSAGTQNGINANLVDYAALKADPGTLRSYLSQLCHVDLNALDDARKLALLINAYNAVMLAMIVAYDVQGSVWDVDNIFGIKFATVGGEKRSLDDLEHVMIRGRYGCDPMGSPSLSTRLGVSGRIHAAVNCASLSCPDLYLEPFVHDRLDAQLTSATRAWLADATKNPGLSGSELRLSKIFYWYGCDMALESGTTIHDWVTQYSDMVVPPSASITHVDYDWGLNAATNIETGYGLRASSGCRRHEAMGLMISILLAVIYRQ